MTETTALGRRERKKEETRQRIFLAAIELFNERGFDATTIDDITQRADVAKGTFFSYFPRKEAVIEYLAEEWMQVAEEKAASRQQSAADRLRAIYAAAARSYAENPDLTRAVMRASAERMCCPAPGGAWLRFEELALDILRQGQESGEFSREVDPNVLHGVLISCFVGSVMWWLGERADSDDPAVRELPLDRVVQNLQAVAFDGIRARREA